MFGKPVQTYVDGKLYFDVQLDRKRQAALRPRSTPTSRNSG